MKNLSAFSFNIFQCNGVAQIFLRPDRVSNGLIWKIKMLVITYCPLGFQYEGHIILLRLIILGRTRLFQSGNLKIVGKMAKIWIHYFANSQ